MKKEMRKAVSLILSASLVLASFAGTGTVQAAKETRTRIEAKEPIRWRTQKIRTMPQDMS